MRSARFLTWACIAVGTASGTGIAVAAQNQGVTLNGESGFAVMNGTCTRLILAGKDRGCFSKLLNTMYSNSRTGFVFLTADDTAVTFSGMDTRAKGNHAVSILDYVITGRAGTETRTVPATGTCTYTNPHAGPVRVNCSASTKEGLFSASFVSDGKLPKIERF